MAHLGAHLGAHPRGEATGRSGLVRLLPLICLATLGPSCAEPADALRCPADRGCGFAQVSAGYAHTCALYGVIDGERGDYGQVLCWGHNPDGRLGFASGLGLSVTARPQLVPGIDDAVAVAAAGYHSCALRASGDVLCWGRNDHGEIGQQGPGSLVPTPVDAPATIKGFVSLVAGTQSGNLDGEPSPVGGVTCGVQDNGELHCWGVNQGGQLGGSAPSLQRPTRLDLEAEVAQVAIGQDFLCARTDSSDLICWGGPYSTLDAPTEIDVSGEVVEVVASQLSACMRLVDGSVACERVGGRRMA